MEKDITLYSGYRKPTKSELENEWNTEYFFSELTGLHQNNKLNEKYKNLIIDNIYKFSSIETIIPTKELDIYHYDSINDLKRYIKHMNKDIDSLVKAYQLNEPLPYPLFLKGKNLPPKNESFVILGGRTRTSIAIILGIKNIKGIVINLDKLNKFLQPYWIEDFKNSDYLFRGYDLFQSEEYQELFKFYVIGELKVFPEPETLLYLRDKLKEQAEQLKIKFGVK
jgi:hypothetical protein